MTFPGYFTCRYFAPSKIIPTGPTNNNHFTMPPYGEPDWATPGDTAVTTTTTTSVGLAPNVTASITQPTTNGNSAATGYVVECVENATFRDSTEFCVECTE